jgi:hypothetical protein
MSDELWTKITQTLLRRQAVQPSEAFVMRVMARVNALEKPAPFFSWRGWLIPSFGAAFAASMMMASFSVPAKTEVAAETVLLADSPAESEWVFADNNMNDNALGYTLEDMR